MTAESVAEVMLEAARKFLSENLDFNEVEIKNTACGVHVRLVRNAPLYYQPYPYNPQLIARQNGYWKDGYWHSANP